MEYQSPLLAGLQSTLGMSPSPGSGIEVPSALIPTMEIPMPLVAALPSPSGGVDLRGVYGSVLCKGSVNQGISTGAQTIVVAILDRGVYRLFCNLNVFSSGFTASSALIYAARLALQNPEVTIQGDLITDLASNFNIFGDMGVFSFQKPGWRVVLTTEATGGAQTIGAQAILKASRLL